MARRRPLAPAAHACPGIDPGDLPDATPAGYSPTAHCLEELQLYGWRAFADEPDPRPLPEVPALHAAVADVMDALVVAFTDTRLEPDLEDLLWGQVNLFHRAIDRVQRALDANEDAQRRSQSAQDGSEIRSVELERLVAEGMSLVERRCAFEILRDTAAELFERHTGSTWRPKAGSQASRRTLTAAMIDSRDFLSAERRAAAETLVPKGTRIAVAGGVDVTDTDAVWRALDKVHAKHPDLVLLHGGSPRGAEHLARLWADQRKVPQVVFRPDWTKDGKAAPFRRNDALLQTCPVGVIVFPGAGITQNLADKARMMGIPVWRCSA